MSYHEKVKGSDIGLNDRFINPFDYGCATVVKIEEKDDHNVLHLVRPFIHTSVFTVADNRVLWYIGVEQYEIIAYPEKTYNIVKNKKQIS